MILFVASLFAKSQIRLPIFHGKAWCKCHTRTFAGLYDIERTFLWVCNKRLHPLAHTKACITRNASRHPTPTRCDRHNPTFFVRCFYRRCTRVSKAIHKFITEGGIGFGFNAGVAPIFQNICKWITFSFKRVGVSRCGFSIVSIWINQFSPFFGVFF